MYIKGVVTRLKTVATDCQPYTSTSVGDIYPWSELQPFFCVRGEIVCRCTKKKKKQKQQLVNEHDVFIVML